MDLILVQISVEVAMTNTNDLCIKMYLDFMDKGFVVKGNCNK